MRSHGLSVTDDKSRADRFLLHIAGNCALARFPPNCLDAPGRIRTCDLALRRRALYPLSYRRGSRSVPPVEVSARIVTLQLAERFTISRSSRTEEDVVQIEVRAGDVVGFGE